VATSTQPGEGQRQVPSARPREPRLNLGLAAGLVGPMLIPGHTLKSQFAFPTQPGNGSAPTSDRAALDQYLPGRVLAPRRLITNQSICYSRRSACRISLAS
jgi:hypothetical protein